MCARSMTTTAMTIVQPEFKPVFKVKFIGSNLHCTFRSNFVAFTGLVKLWVTAVLGVSWEEGWGYAEGSDMRLCFNRLLWVLLALIYRIPCVFSSMWLVWVFKLFNGFLIGVSVLQTVVPTVAWIWSFLIDVFSACRMKVLPLILLVVFHLMDCDSEHWGSSESGSAFVVLCFRTPSAAANKPSSVLQQCCEGISALEICSACAACSCLTIKPIAVKECCNGTMLVPVAPKSN